VDAAFSAVKRTGNSCKVEYRLASADGTDLRPERWVAAEGTVVRGADGQPDQLLGVTRDTTERKQAEQALAERDALIGLAEKVTRVGNYTVDINTKRVRVSEGCIAIHGFPEGTAEIRRDDWRAGVHPDDLAHFDRQLSQAFTERWPEYKLDYRIIRSSGEIRWIEERAVIAYDGKARPERLVGVNIDVTERKRVEEQQRTLMAELDHRVKNALATVSAVVSHTRQGSKSIADFVAALDGRIRSMARTHELLSSRGWDGVSLSELVRRVLAPYATGNNAEICGPELTLSAEAGQVVSMALHELTTNAAKHGALSVHDGQVSVHWHRASNGNTDAPLAIEWQETGGPAVQTPEACGYGMEVIRDLIPYELGGRVDLAFAADGLRCHLEIPAGWLSNGSRSLGAVS
jgi:PAS domain S-box-containing protein